MRELIEQIVKITELTSMTDCQIAFLYDHIEVWDSYNEDCSQILTEFDTLVRPYQEKLAYNAHDVIDEYNYRLDTYLTGLWREVPDHD